MLEEKRNKIRTHFRENKKLYYGIGIGTVVGGFGVLLAANRAEVVTIVDSFKLQWKPVTTTQVTMVPAPSRRMHPGFLVHCEEDDMTYGSIRQTAKVDNLNPMHLSEHLKGARDDVGGKHYKIMGEAPAPTPA